jgi:hypothetical protein
LGLEAPDVEESAQDVTGKIIRLVLNLSPEQRVRALALIEQMNREGRT